MSLFGFVFGTALCVKPRPMAEATPDCRCGCGRSAVGVRHSAPSLNSRSPQHSNPHCNNFVTRCQLGFVFWFCFALIFFSPSVSEAVFLSLGRRRGCLTRCQPQQVEPRLGQHGSSLRRLQHWGRGENSEQNPRRATQSRAGTPQPAGSAQLRFQQPRVESLRVSLPPNG